MSSPGGFQPLRSLARVKMPARRRSSAINGIQSVKKNAARPEWFERRTAAENQPYFVLTAVNGRELGCGAFYSSRRAMENGIQSVMASGPAAAVVDLSQA